VGLEFLLELLMTKKVSFFVLVGIVIAFAVLAYQLMASFFVPLFLSVVLVIVFWPLHERCLKLCRGRQRVAAALTTTAVLLIVLVPTIIIASMAAAEGLAMVSRFDKDLVKVKLRELRIRFGVETPYLVDLREIEDSLAAIKDQPNPAARFGAINALGERLERLELKLATSVPPPPKVDTTLLEVAFKTLKETDPEDELAYENAFGKASEEFHDYRLALLGGPYQAWLKELANPTDEQIAQLMQQATARGSGSLLSVTGKTGAAAGSVVLGLSIMIMAMYFFFADGAAINWGVMSAIPLDEDYKRELMTEFDRTSRAVVVATLLAAVVQGLLAGVGYYFAGTGSVFLLTLLTMVCALIPFVGAAIVWVPACIYLYFVEDRATAAILLFIYCAAVVSTADNVVKPWVLHGQSNLHPLLALLSVLGGVQALGPIGILVGPMVVVFLQTLLRILQRELKTIERQGAADTG
jgi:predicted PurR-regulated permease PerM